MLDQCDRPPFCPAERGVHQALAQIQFPACHQVLAQGPQNGVQYPGALPLLETAVTGLVGPVAARKILPWRACAQNPKNPVQCLPSIDPASTAAVRPLPLLLIPLHKIAYAFPLKIAQIRHASGLRQLLQERKSLFSRYIGETGSSQFCSCQSTQEPQGSTRVGLNTVNNPIKITYFRSISIRFHKRIESALNRWSPLYKSCKINEFCALRCGGLLNP